MQMFYVCLPYVGLKEKGWENAIMNIRIVGHALCFI